MSEICFCLHSLKDDVIYDDLNSQLCKMRMLIDLFLCVFY